MQCEILRNVVEHRALTPAATESEDVTVTVQPLAHPWLVVMTYDCDLLHDHDMRSSIALEEKQQEDWERNFRRICPHILFCEAYEESEIKALYELTNNRSIKRIKDNQVERLHVLPDPSTEDAIASVPQLFLDFKKSFSLPTQSVYDGLSEFGLQRVAVLSGDHRFDLMHRFYSFLSRVGIP